ncbi:MAG: ribose 1,5-bisphosphate isomerase [Candidatus Thermoplasmatota archaeon]|nr:ribose 1,5-bisphosphate isomerase [Candidatus Thermoplasmatota archaeon]
MGLEEFEGLSPREIAEKIESMEIRGAADIARAGAYALNRSVKEYPGDDLEGLKAELESCAEMLRSTRPTAVSLKNAIEYVMHTGAEDTQELKEKIKKNSSEFVEKSLQAGDDIAEYGGKRINDGDVILTHCNSSMALGAIKYAWDEGKEISVIATESRPKKQGYITVRELSDHGVPVTLIVDSAVRYKMEEVDKVYVGADTIASNGAVINKIGTSQVALCAHESRVPVSVCAETYKFSRETAFGDLVEIEERDASEIADPEEFPGVQISNPVFDATPSEYIDSIITEEGVISPGGAYRIIKEMER